MSTVYTDDGMMTEEFSRWFQDSLLEKIGEVVDISEDWLIKHDAPIIDYHTIQHVIIESLNLNCAVAWRNALDKKLGLPETHPDWRRRHNKLADS